MRIDGVGEVEVDHAIAVQHHTEAGTDGDRVAGLQAESGGQAGRLGAGAGPVQKFPIIWHIKATPFFRLEPYQPDSQVKVRRSAAS